MIQDHSNAESGAATHAPESISTGSPRLVRSASALALLGTIVLMMVAGAFITPRAARSMSQARPAATHPAAVETGDPHC